MKKCLMLTAMLTTIGSSVVYANSDISKFLTSNGKPISNNTLSNNFDKVHSNKNCNNSNTQDNQYNNSHNNSPERPNNENLNQDNASILTIEQQVVDLVNVARAKEGLPPLQLDTQLHNVARAKSEDMSSKNYFSHTSPTYGTPFDMLKQFGITYKTAGENIARGQRTAQDVVDAWLNSEGHRRNILSNSFTHIGVGFYNNYWTQLFISK